MRGKRFFLIIGLTIAFVAMSFKNTIHGRIVCFGDSITYGALVDGHSWVYFLSQKHSEVNFINAGRSGRKTSDKEELLPVLKRYPSADYYLIFLGVNDLKDGTDSMIDSCIVNMKWMITEIKNSYANANIVILAPTDINLQAMNETNVKKKYNENTKQSLYKLETKYKALAKEEQVGFLSLLHSVSKSNYVDGLHPNIEGQKQIAKAVWIGLNKLF
jgi:acyl-CoA thioesterase I